MLIRVWQIDRPALLTTIDLRLGPKFRPHFFPIQIPALEVPGTQFALFVFLITGPLLQDSDLHKRAIQQAPCFF